MNIEVKEIDKMVFIATLPRSGSSMTTGILEICGAFGGETIGETPANKKGMFENRILNAMTIRPILNELDIRGAKGLHSIQKCGGPNAELFEHYKSDLTYGLYRQGYKGGVAYYKNGLFTFFFDRINEIFPDAVWILPNRRDDDVIKSHKRLNPKKSRTKIINEIGAYREMYRHILSTAKDRAHLVDTERVANGDFDQIKSIVESLGLEWKQEAIDEFVEIDLWGDSPTKPEFIERGKATADSEDELPQIGKSR